MAADKLVDSTKLENALTATAEAIRAKTGDSATIAFDMTDDKGFADAVDAIPSGGGAKTYTLSICSVFNGTEIVFGSSDGCHDESLNHSDDPINFEVLCGTPIYLSSQVGLDAVNCNPLTAYKILNNNRIWLLMDQNVTNPGDTITLTVSED